MELSFSSIVLLIIVSTISSVVSGMMGMGGILLLPIIASIVDVIYIVPFFSAVLIFSNGARIILYFGSIRWKLVCYYIIGVLPGAVLGLNTYLYLPPSLVRIMMGFFILFVAHAPLSKSGIKIHSHAFMAVGFVCGVIGIFFGAVGPLLAPVFLHKGIIKEELIATKASCQAVNHIINVFLYGLIGGNVFGNWIIIVCLGALVIGGTFIGKKLLKRLSEKRFVIAFKVLLTIIAGRIVVNELIKLLE